jgi:hypothetical protein
MSLADLLTRRSDHFSGQLFEGTKNRSAMMYRIKKAESLAATVCCKDEMIWTLLVACGYAAAGTGGVACLARLLAGDDVPVRDDSKIWLEVGPMSPRIKEGTTRIDLAVGDVESRNEKGGISLRSVDDSWVCFCECKWYSDLSVKVANDAHRDQFVRVIENTISFQKARGERELVSRPFTTLITPGCFAPDCSNKPKTPMSRLYQYKFQEYVGDSSCILRDIDACELKPRIRSDFVHPVDVDDKLQQQIDALRLHWVTYDQLFQQLPDSPFREPIVAFWQCRGNYIGRDTNAPN